MTPDSFEPEYRDHRYAAHGFFEVTFDHTVDEVWDAWIALTATTGTTAKYTCEVRHPGDEHMLGRVRAWRYPMPGGFTARSWEWLTEVDRPRVVTFEGVASPPLAFAGGTTHFESHGRSKTLLRHDEYFLFGNRLLRPFSRPIFRLLSAQNHIYVEAQLREILRNRDRTER